MRKAWPLLPPDLRRTASNIASIRIGVAAYALILPASIISKIVNSTPAEFMSYLAGLTPILGTIGLIAAIVILYLRLTRTAPQFLHAYKEMMPDLEDRIEAAYDSRGIGDVLAPWIRSKSNFMKRLMMRLASRFSLHP